MAIETRCCIAGGGPAGMMLGFLLARMGADVVVLEKHGDFLRDFRGDTIHPSTLQLMFELGLLSDFLSRPHQEVREVAGNIGGHQVKLGDFTHLPTHSKFLALMPQWDFLNFLVEHGRQYSGFNIRMSTQATGLIEEGGRVVGLAANGPEGPLEIRTPLVIAADGRHSVLRERARLPVRDLGAPMDVLWLRMSRRAGDPEQTLGYIAPGKLFVMLNREDYWQCGYIIPKGALDGMKSAGIERFREEIAALEPVLRDRVSELRDWNDVSLLTVKVDRLEQWWKPGFLCIGDAAHAMSPIGGVGINLAVQDAVAAANILGTKIVARTVSVHDLAAVQRRRMFPTRLTQGLQLLIQNNVVRQVLASKDSFPVPWPVKLMQRWAWLRRIPARIIGVGFRPEHIRTPEIVTGGEQAVRS